MARHRAIGRALTVAFAVVAVVLVLLLALAEVPSMRPATYTSTTTETRLVTSTVTQDQTMTVVTGLSGSSTTYPLVTVTLETVEVYVVLPYCTTISGSKTIAWSEAVGGTTTTSYLYPTGHLNSTFYATVVTASAVGVSFQTESTSVSC